MQALVDHLGCFLLYDLGWPGCITNLAVYKELHFGMYPEQYLRPDEYILADQGKSSYILVLVYFLV